MIARPKRILVPTDFSEPANHALRYASDLACRLGASLTVLYSDAFLPPVDYTATIGGWDASAFEELKFIAEKQLRHDAAANIDPAVPYETVVYVATPLDGILTHAHESGAGLIVMGTHGRSGVQRLIIGSVTEAVMRAASVPVLAVPPRAPQSQMRMVVCPAILDETYLDALRFAETIVPWDAEFIVFRTSDQEDVRDLADQLAELRRWLPESIAARARLKIAGEDRLAEHIERYAEGAGADLIVATEPAQRSAADVLRGTFAARVLQHSNCAVLTVNRPAAIRPVRQRPIERTAAVY